MSFCHFFSHFLIFNITEAAATARLYFLPESGTFEMGKSFQIRAVVDTGEQSTNAFEDTISFSKDTLEVTNISNDKQTGIDYYEVKEGEGNWVKTESPYLLKDQARQSVIQVKAVDKASNERIETIQPSQLAVGISSKEKIKEITKINKLLASILRYKIMIAVAIIIIILLFLIICLFYRKKKQNKGVLPNIDLKR